MYDICISRYKFNVLVGVNYYFKKRDREVSLPGIHSYRQIAVVFSENQRLAYIKMQ